MSFILLVGKQNVFQLVNLGEETIGLGVIALLPSVPPEFPFALLIFHRGKLIE